MQSRVESFCENVRDTTAAAHGTMLEAIRAGDHRRADALARDHLAEWQRILAPAP
jgi:DNA-binding GntR family transcriptional regulator